jgi:hypothetical protein
VHRGDALAPLAAGVLEGEARDARRGLLGDDLQALDHARHHLVLDAAVEPLGVLAHHDQVDVREARGHARQRQRRAQVGVELERPAQAHVDRLEALADRRRHRPLERHAVAHDRVEHLARQRVAVERERLGARDVRLPVELRAGRLEHAHGGGGHFGTNPVAGNQGDGSHGRRAAADAGYPSPPGAPDPRQEVADSAQAEAALDVEDQILRVEPPGDPLVAPEHGDPGANLQQIARSDVALPAQVVAGELDAAPFEVGSGSAGGGDVFGE